MQRLCMARRGVPALIQELSHVQQFFIPHTSTQLFSVHDFAAKTLHLQRWISKFLAEPTAWYSCAGDSKVHHGLLELVVTVKSAFSSSGRPAQSHKDLLVTAALK